MKSKFILLLFIGILIIFLSSNVLALPNPAAVYCEEMGYNYKIEKTKAGERGICIVKDKEFGEWDFFKGKVGKEYSYCAKKGYDLEVKREDKDGYDVEYAVCISKDGKVKKKMLEMMEEMGDFSLKENGLRSEIEESKIRSKDGREISIVEEKTSISKEELVGQGSLPSSFDWRNYNGHSYIGTIRDQGSCGSCYAFAAIAAAEGTYNFAMNLTDNNVANFSEAFLAFCLSDYYAGFDGCRGANYEYEELDALVDGGMGICNESDFPYIDHEQPCKPSYWDAPRIEFGHWERIWSNNIAAMKEAIMTYGAIDVDVYADSSFQSYSGGGIFSDSRTDCPNGYYTTANHAVSLVGWGHDDTYGDYWILRNSWGTGWGEDGYMNITVNSARVACAPAHLEYGKLEPYLISPTEPIEVSQNNFFDFIVGINCTKGPCGIVSGLLKIINFISQPTTCSDIWGFDCGANPDQDNTFDDCSNTNGNDEHIEEIYLDKDKVGIGEEIEVTCEVMIDQTAGCQAWNDDNLYLYYRNSSVGTWRKIHYISQVFDCYNYSITFIPDNVEAEHQVRCITGWNVPEGECATGYWYDNDDANFTVINDAISTTIDDTPFYTNMSQPQSCGSMQENDTCELTWNVKATGEPETYKLYSLFSPDFFISKRKTDTVNINISEGAGEFVSITIYNYPITFGNLDPGTQNNSASGNGNYIVHIDDTTTVNVDLYHKGTNFIKDSNNINVNNMKWFNSNNVGSAYIMQNIYDYPSNKVGDVVPNTNVSIYYWLSIPGGQAAATNYLSDITIKAVETGGSPLGGSSAKSTSSTSAKLTKSVIEEKEPEETGEEQVEEKEEKKEEIIQLNPKTNIIKLN